MWKALNKYLGIISNIVFAFTCLSLFTKLNSFSSIKSFLISIWEDLSEILAFISTTIHFLLIPYTYFRDFIFSFFNFDLPEIYEDIIIVSLFLAFHYLNNILGTDLKQLKKYFNRRIKLQQNIIRNFDFQRPIDTRNKLLREFLKTEVIFEEFSPKRKNWPVNLINFNFEGDINLLAFRKMQQADLNILDEILKEIETHNPLDTEKADLRLGIIIIIFILTLIDLGIHEQTFKPFLYWMGAMTLGICISIILYSLFYFTVVKAAKFLYNRILKYINGEKPLTKTAEYNFRKTMKKYKIKI